MAASRFKIGSKIYRASALEEVSLKDILMFNQECEDMGLRRRFADVERVAAEMDGMTEAQAEQHPEKYLMVSVTVWAARRLGGEQLSVEEAINFPIKNLEFLPATEDRKPGPTKGATKPRKASAPAARRPAVLSDEPTTPQT